MRKETFIALIVLMLFSGTLGFSAEKRVYRFGDDNNKLIFVKGSPWHPEGFDKPLILRARHVEKQPIIDGQGDDPAWVQAESLTVPLAYGSVKKATLKAVYTEKEIFLLVSWPDPTKDDQHHPWVWNAGLERYVEGPQVEDSLLVSLEAGCDWTPSLLSGYVYDFDGWHWLASQTNPLGQAVDTNGHTQTSRRQRSWARYTVRASRPSWQLKFDGFGTNRLTAPWQDLERIYRFAPISKLIWFRNAPDGELEPSAFVRRVGPPAISVEKAEGPSGLVRLTSTGNAQPQLVRQFEPVKLKGDAGEVAAKGRWSDGRWTVEFRRVLETPARTATDVIFSRVTQFSVHVFDRTEHVHESSESGRLWLQFEPSAPSTR